MKKGLLFLALLGLFTIATPKIADAAENCKVVILTCNNVSRYVVICDGIDYEFWVSYYCNNSGQ